MGGGGRDREFSCGLRGDRMREMEGVEKYHKNSRNMEYEIKRLIYSFLCKQNINFRIFQIIMEKQLGNIYECFPFFRFDFLNA